MLKFFSNHFDAIITVTVTVVGFIITYILTKRSFFDEVRKSKISHNVEMIHSLPLELCELMSKIQKQTKKNPVSPKDYESIMTKIFAYGSRDAVKITTEIQQTFYKVAKTDEDYGQRLLVLFALLITQLKYDISDEVISSDNWLRLKLNDYDTSKSMLTLKINECVSELGLNKEFQVK